MTNSITTKIAVAATVFGLGGLGGFAISSNPARDAQATGQAPIAAPLASTVTPATAKAGSSPQQVTTRSSGGAPPTTVPATSTPRRTAGIEIESD